MKFVAIFFVACVAVALAIPADDKYTTKFDNVNVDEILKSDRLLRSYVNCLKGTANCSPDGAELKRLLPDALETDCTKCSEKQKEASRRIISYLVNEKPDLWKELESQYDPTGKYKTKYEEDYKKIKSQ